MSDVQVSIDRDFARFGEKSFAINKINTVEVRSRKPYGKIGAFLFGLLTLMWLLMFLGSVLQGSPVFVVAVLALGSGWLTWWAWKRSGIVEYQLYLMTSSSQAQAITSRDGGMISGLRDQIERAIAGRLP